MEVLVTDFSARLRQVHLSFGASVGDLIHELSRERGIPHTDFYVKNNGRLLGGDEELQTDGWYRLEPRLCGGKGGFGSMLRALGAQIEKTTNREACRDLSGRRLRDVNHEKEMAEWLKKQADREAEKEQRRLERLQRKLAEPKHYFNDPEYDRQCQDMSERVEESIKKGLQASSSGTSGVSRKRPSPYGADPGKRPRLWQGELDGLSSSEDESEDSDEEASPSSSTSQSSSTLPSHTTPHNPSASRFISSAQHTSTAGTMASVTQMEAEPVAQGEAEPAAQVEAEPAAQAEAESAAQAEAESAAQAEAKSAAQAEAEFAAQAEAEFAAQAEAESVAQAEAESVAQAEAESVAQAEAESVAQAEAESVAQAEAESVAQAEVESVPQKEEEPAVQTEAPAPVMSKTQQITPGPEELSQAERTATPLADVGELDLQTVEGAVELEALGMERLKGELMHLGMKCGGTLQERAARLFSVRGLTKEQIPPALLAKPTKPRKK